MIIPRQYYCSVCSGLFNQMTSGPLRQYCPDHDGQKFKQKPDRQEYNSNFYRKQRAQKAVKYGLIEVWEKRIEANLEKNRKIQARIDAVLKLTKSCSTCRHWTPKPDFKSGPCFVSNDDAPRPVKKADDVCGEWTPKEKKR